VLKPSLLSQTLTLLPTPPVPPRTHTATHPPTLSTARSSRTGHTATPHTSTAALSTTLAT
jgi:hypothetical protein